MNKYPRDGVVYPKKYAVGDMVYARLSANIFLSAIRVGSAKSLEDPYTVYSVFDNSLVDGDPIYFYYIRNQYTGSYLYVCGENIISDDELPAIEDINQEDLENYINFA